MRRLVLPTFVFAAACVLSVLHPVAAATSSTTQATTHPSLDTLRQNLATNWGDVDAHLTLAKAIHDDGQLLTAFLICENAHSLFGDDAFGASFGKIFLGRDPTIFRAKEKILRLATQVDRNDVRPVLELAALYRARGIFDLTVQCLRRAMEIKPDDSHICEMLVDALNDNGSSDDANEVLNTWCKAHPDAALSWRQNIRDQLKQNTDVADSMLQNALAKFPDDGPLHLMRGQLRLQQGRNDDAQPDLAAAADLLPDSSDAQAAAAHFFLKVRQDSAQALVYYLRTYFLNPGFNDWETIDTRIHAAAQAVADAKLASLNASHVPEATLLADEDSFIVTTAITTAGSAWDDALIEPLLHLAASDAPEVREAATQILSDHLDHNSDARLRMKLADGNPWIRAAAAKVGGSLWQTAATKELTPLLSDPTSLVRLSAAVALINDGDPAARTIVLHYRQRSNGEPDPWVRGEVDEALAAAVPKGP